MFRRNYLNSFFNNIITRSKILHHNKYLLNYDEKNSWKIVMYIYIFFLKKVVLILIEENYIFYSSNGKNKKKMYIY